METGKRLQIQCYPYILSTDK